MPGLPKIMVTGSNGQVGSELREISVSYPAYEFEFLDRVTVDITDFDKVQRLISLYKPSYFINCAAYTEVDKAEENDEIAFEINGKAVGAIAEICKNNNVRFIHISTDYVFSGCGMAPLKETNSVQPLNKYGASKLLGENLAMEKNPDTVIIRTSWLYSSYGRNFVKTMLRLMKENKNLNVVSDQVGSPTYAADLAVAITDIILSGEWQPGIFHFSNDGVVSWYEFATAIRDICQLDCTVHPINTTQYPTPAKRPSYSVLDKSKIRKIYKIKLEPWRERLEVCLDKLMASNV